MGVEVGGRERTRLRFEKSKALLAAKRLICCCNFPFLSLSSPVLATDAEATRKERRELTLLLLVSLSGERRAAATKEEGEGETAAAATTADDDERRRRAGDAPAVLVPFAGQTIAGVRTAMAEDSIWK